MACRSRAWSCSCARSTTARQNASLDPYLSLMKLWLTPSLRARSRMVADWYWARGQAGPYSVIASMITSHEKYGYTPLPILMLAKDGKIIADDSRAVRFETGGVYTDELT